jgi:hypothetical protein
MATLTGNQPLNINKKVLKLKKKKNVKSMRSISKNMK